MPFLPFFVVISLSSIGMAPGDTDFGWVGCGWGGGAEGVGEGCRVLSRQFHCRRRVPDMVATVKLLAQGRGGLKPSRRANSPDAIRMRWARRTRRCWQGNAAIWGDGGGGEGGRGAVGSVAHGAGGCDRQSLSCPIKSRHFPPRISDRAGVRGNGKLRRWRLRLVANVREGWVGALDGERE